MWKLFLGTAIPLVLLLSGCARLITPNYVPSNPYRGEGPIQVDPFEYTAAKAERVSAHEVETNPEGVGSIYTSSRIDVLFTDALKSELVHSGYEVVPTDETVVSGVIERFYLDWVGPKDKTFELIVDFAIRSQDEKVFSYQCTSVQKKPKSVVITSPLVAPALRECFQQFIKGAQDAKVF